MPHPASKNDSSATSKPSVDATDLFDLDLPEIEAADEPLPHPEPSFALQMRHAAFLLRNQPPDFYEKRRARMNPEPFVMD